MDRWLHIPMIEREDEEDEFAKAVGIDLKGIDLRDAQTVPNDEEELNNRTLDAVENEEDSDLWSHLHNAA